MIERSLEADYVVIGAGAMALAFVDALLDESDATVLGRTRPRRPGAAGRRRPGAGRGPHGRGRCLTPLASARGPCTMKP